MARIKKVELTDSEKTLSDGALFWDMDALLKEDYEVRIEQLERMGQLTESLLERKAIPQVRLDYFFDPKMDVGGYGKSMAEVYERNGTSGRAIFRHGNFLPHLRYFINGPDLPRPTIDGFCKIIEDDAGTSGMVLDQICKFVRKEVRDRRLPHEAAWEFFKLAHEIGKPTVAESVRKAAMSAKRK
jgi:hypothetical protein